MRREHDLAGVSTATAKAKTRIDAKTDAWSAERLLLDVIDTVREPLVVLDSAFRVAHANRAFFATFRASREDTIGESLFSLGDHQWDIPPLRALLHERLAIHPQLSDIEVDHVFPGVGRRIMMLNARDIAQLPGDPRVTLLTIEDVTKQRLAERRLAAQHRELQRSNAALEDFAFIASHDLQEPLRKILSFGQRLETVAGPLLEGPAKQYLARMLNAATRMRTLVSDILTYSQAAVATQPFARADLAAIARDVVADLEIAIADTGGRVELGGLPAIDADPVQMRQLLQNLVGNALKFRRPGVAPVVRVDAAPSAEDCVLLTVTDNGIGIKSDHLDRIFRVFERLHSRGEYEGSGVGLAVCRRIVERHGGSIVATSTLGQGTTFSVTLPATHEDAEYAP